MSRDTGEAQRVSLALSKRCALAQCVLQPSVSSSFLSAISMLEIALAWSIVLGIGLESRHRDHVILLAGVQRLVHEVDAEVGPQVHGGGVEVGVGVHWLRYG